MRAQLRLAAVFVLVLASSSAPLRLAQAANPAPTAQTVTVQSGFIQNTANNGGVNANRLTLPAAALGFAAPNVRVAPTLTALSPSKVAAGSPTFTLTVNGTSYYSNSVVRWDGSDRPTTFLSSTQLNASISAADVAAGGPFAVTVFTPAPGGGASSPINLKLYTRAGQDATADVEQGQPNFAASSANNALMPGGANRLNTPTALAVDSQSGRLFVADEFNNRVLSWPNAAALANGQPADLVLGQADFNATTPNTGGRSAASLDFPGGVALDASGNLYAADTNNSRVLEYNAPLSTGMAASRVFGQAGSFNTGVVNKGGVSADSLSFPAGLALDAQGNLYVADNGNNRVLEYNTPLSADTTADHVFGQPNFAQHAGNNGGVSAVSLESPFGVGLDAQGNLYVADTFNSRVLEYDSPLTTDQIADRVLGQHDFTHNAQNNGGVSSSSLGTPYDVALDVWGNLYVADGFNNRVLEYYAPLITHAAAGRVFGQPSFTSNTANNGGLSATSLAFPTGVALDSHSNLYVADFSNNRVLEYDWALVNIYLPLVRR